MNLPLLFFIAVIGWGLWTTRRTVRKSRSPREKAIAIRVAAFCWLGVFVFIIGLMFLPNKGRVLLLLPAFLVAVTVSKAARSVRDRIRREEQGVIDLERMKRVN